MVRRAGRTRDEWITARRDELGMSWEELATAIGKSSEGLRHLRTGRSDGHPRTRRHLEDALRWERGSLHRIDQGEAPIPLPVSVVPDGRSPAERGEPLDAVALLKQIRQQVGPRAFWLAVAHLEAEESDTESDLATGG